MIRVKRLLNVVPDRRVRVRPASRATLLLVACAFAGTAVLLDARQPATPPPPVTTSPVSETQSTPMAAATPDYQLAPNDLVQFTVWEIAGPGKEAVLVKRITASGGVSLPYVGTVAVAGKSEADAEKAISKAYSDGQFLEHAVVSVTALERSDGINVPWIGSSNARAAATPQPTTPSVPVADRAAAVRREVYLAKLMEQRAIATTDLARLSSRTSPDDPIVAGLKERVESFDEEIAKLAAETDGSRIKAVASAETSSPLGQFKKLQRDRQEIVDEIERVKTADGEKSGEQVDQLRSLLAHVDATIAEKAGPVGEYYISGAVGRPGVYSLSGRKISLRQAMIAADGLKGNADGTAIQVVRRLPETGKEEVKQLRWVDVRDLKDGEFYLMPSDQILVGGRMEGGVDDANGVATQPTTMPARP